MSRKAVRTDAYMGKTLLDWFAGQVVASGKLSLGTRLELEAKIAYDLAQAMLDEKKRREEE